MVIRLVALSDLLRLDFSSELPIHRDPNATGGRWLVLLLENVGQMVEQRNDGRHRRLAQAVIHVFQEILSIFIALIRCQLEPLDRTGSIFWDLLPKQIELAEGILGVLIALFRCGGEPADGGFHILWRIFPLEQQLAQPVLRKLITPAC